MSGSPSIFFISSFISCLLIFSPSKYCFLTIIISITANIKIIKSITNAIIIALSLSHSIWSPSPKRATVGSSTMKKKKKINPTPKVVKDLKVIFMPSTAFFIENRFFVPLIGSIFLKSGIIAFVVKRKPY
jgi:hypothetical protein